MKAMILAAGRGERMRPLTDTCPKPLLIVGGKPLIVWHIEHLANAGFNDIVINHAYLGDRIEHILGTGEKWAVRLNYSAEKEALETAGGIANALPLLGKEPFLVINGDIFCDYDLNRAYTIAQEMTQQGLLAHLVLVENPSHHPQGDFSLENGKIVHKDTEKLTFSGIGVYHPTLFSTIISGEKAKLAPLLNVAISQGKVTGECHCGVWTDVGTPIRLTELNASLFKQSALTPKK